MGQQKSKSPTLINDKSLNQPTDHSSSLSSPPNVSTGVTVDKAPENKASTYITELYSQIKESKAVRQK